MPSRPRLSPNHLGPESSRADTLHVLEPSRDRQGSSMLTGHSVKILLLLTAPSLFIGCAHPGPLLSGRATYGTLKTSLSHLEFENQQLRTKVTQLETENR